MQVRAGTRLYSAGDIVGYLECRHLTSLSLKDLDSRLPRASDDDSAKLVQDMGFAHEGAYLEALKATGLDVFEVKDDGTPQEQAAATCEAMRAGKAVIFQAVFLTNSLYGRADFLRRVEVPSALGTWSYEVVDTKLARSPKAKFIIQLCFYSALLGEIQQREPATMSLVLGDRSERHFRYASYSRYFRRVRQRFLEFVGSGPHPTYPEKVDHCGVCAWRDICQAQWLQDDHLNQVAGITRTHVERLRAAQITTMAALARLEPGTVIPRITADVVDRLRDQASLQSIQKSGGKPEVHVLPLDPEGRRGFHRLPQPDPGDIFFDMEGDPYEEGGLEYLFGVYWIERGEPRFRPFWAHNRDDERRAFEEFMDFVAHRMALFPRMHIYHYAHYEPTKLKHLMSLHGTRESSLDDLLRNGRFVDLYKVVRESIRTSEAGYSIKDIEHFYLPPREGEITDAGASIVYYERWKQSQDQAELNKIEAYNREDCRSTHLLREWLLQFRPGGVAWFIKEADEPTDEKPEETALLEQELAARREALLAGAPTDRAEWTSEHHMRELVGQLLDFHRRCDKPGWWEVFARQDMTEGELIDDLECLGGLRLVEGTVPEPVARSKIYSFTFPEQETKLRAGKSCRRADTASSFGSIESFDAQARLVRIKVSNKAVEKSPIPPAFGIGPSGPLKNKVLRIALRRVADSILADDDRFAVAKAILRKSLPNLVGRTLGEPLIANREPLSETIEAVGMLQDGFLFIQGPPGAGKTFTGSRIVVDLLRRGMRVGISSNSHKVIHNLLNAVVKASSELGFSFHGVKKSSRDDPETAFEHPWFANTGDTKEAFSAAAQLVAGTAWAFADETAEGQLDYLFVDEAGQVSLANLVAMSTAARNVVLLGDQMQLSQPIQGVHPGRSGDSALDYLLDGAATISPERGVFLGTTWRMHEHVCRFISDAVYDGRLEPEAKNQHQRLLLSPGAHPALRPTGISFVPVAHEGRSQQCREEAEAVLEMFESLLQQSYCDREGLTHHLTAADILVVAPYNSQVNLLKSLLPANARVGTIDKFQGQEAEVVLVSMTSSNERTLPRNIEFLYDKNRLNVAISRARCVATVLASPELLNIGCRTPQQIELVNTLCWLWEYSTTIPIQLTSTMQTVHDATG